MKLPKEIVEKLNKVKDYPGREVWQLSSTEIIKINVFAEKKIQPKKKPPNKDG